jgi:hypothetical protein
VQGFPDRSAAGTNRRATAPSDRQRTGSSNTVLPRDEMGADNDDDGDDGEVM